jgi:hypothetical protein
LWRVHSSDEKLARMPASSSCLTEMSDLESSGTYRTLWSTIVEQPKRLSPTVPMPITTQCCEFLRRKGSKLRAVYCRNCDRNGVTPELSSQLVASSVVRKTSALVILSTVRMFRSSFVVTLAVNFTSIEDEPQKFTSFLRLPFC